MLSIVRSWLRSPSYREALACSAFAAAIVMGAVFALHATAG